MAIRRNQIPSLWSESSNLNPLGEVSRLQRDIDRMFEDFLSPVTGRSLTGLGTGIERPMRFSPPVDVEETDAHYLLSFDLPGISKEDVQIEFKDNQLIVSGERKEERKEEKKNR